MTEHHSCFNAEVQFLKGSVNKEKMKIREKSLVATYTRAMFVDSFETRHKAKTFPEWFFFLTAYIAYV